MNINLADYPLLANINSPDDLRMLDQSQLTQASMGQWQLKHAMQGEFAAKNIMRLF